MPAVAGRPGVSGAAGRLDPPGVSANLLDLSAASQSKWERVEAPLIGDRGEYRPAVVIAGEAGSFMLGNTVAAGGADIGHSGTLRGVVASFFLVSIGAGFELLVLSPSFSLLPLLSVRAVDGAPSVSASPLSFSASSGSVLVLVVLSRLSLLRALLVLLVVLVVLVRLRADFPVCGGEARHGEINDMPFKKSRYATGGVMGVFWSSCSSLIVALKGPAEGSPAEGRPEVGIGSRKAEVREMADSGVLLETAEGSETADRSSEADGGILGKFAVRGVDTLKLGRVDMLGGLSVLV